MPQALKSRNYDVVVVGAGSAGVTAALAAARNGARTLLLESGPMVGGELISGLPIDGALNARGEWIVGGIMRDLLEKSGELGGYVGPVFDWRLNWGVCFDPEILKIVLIEELAKQGVTTLLYTLAEDVVMKDNRLEGIIAVNKNGRTLITADVFIDCSGDGDLAITAGADFKQGGAAGETQPVSLVFRLGNVDYTEYLSFMRDNPDQFILAENPIITRSRAECAAAVADEGLPFSVLDASGKLMNAAIEEGLMFETTAVYMWPTSLQRREVGLNTTRVAKIDATNMDALSTALSTLTTQVRQCTTFLQKNIPGFGDSHISGVAPRVGIRETRRIVGEYELSTDDVLEGRKSDHGIAKGAHHVDLHGSGRDQERIPVRDGRSYDIPFECLIPKRLSNVLVAGRCFSSSREANGSARVMGPCMAMGEAAGTAAVMMTSNGSRNTRDVSVADLRDNLKAHGAVIDGTN